MKKLPAAWVWACGLFVLMLGLILGTGFNGLYSQDSHEYLRIAREIAELGHPTPPFFWPLAYSGIGALAGKVSGNVLLSLQMISLLSFALSSFFLSKILQRLFGPSDSFLSPSLFAFIALGLSPFALRLGLMVMSDSLCMAGVLGFLYFFFRFQEGENWRDFIAMGLAACLALLSRYVAAVLLLPPVIALVIHLLSKKQWAFLGAGLVFPAICLGYFVWLHPAQAGETLALGLQGWNPLHLFQNSYETSEGTAHYSLPNLLFVAQNWVHPGFFAPGGLAIVLSLRRQKLPAPRIRRLLLITLLFYGLFLAGINVQNRRFLFLSLPLILIWAYPLLRKFWDDFLSKKALSLGLLGAWLALQGALFFMTMKPVLQQNRLQQQIAADLAEYPPQSLYSFEINQALGSYPLPHRLINLWDAEIPEPPSGSFILFNLEKFRERWTGKSPMDHWEYLEKNYQLERIQSWDHGWELYEIQ